MACFKWGGGSDFLLLHFTTSLICYQWSTAKVILCICILLIFLSSKGIPILIIFKPCRTIIMHSWVWGTNLKNVFFWNKYNLLPNYSLFINTSFNLMKIRTSHGYLCGLLDNAVSASLFLLQIPITVLLTRFEDLKLFLCIPVFDKFLINCLQ